MKERVRAALATLDPLRLLDEIRSSSNISPTLLWAMAIRHLCHIETQISIVF